MPYDDLDRFLAHPIDIVAIGTPSGMHADQAIAAVRRGLHVLVEKPLDISTAKVDALLAEADRTGAKIGVFFQERLSPDLVAIKKQIDAGELGAPLYISGEVNWDLGGARLTSITAYRHYSSGQPGDIDYGTVDILYSGSGIAAARDPGDRGGGACGCAERSGGGGV